MEARDSSASMGSAGGPFGPDGGGSAPSPMRSAGWPQQVVTRTAEAATVRKQIRLIVMGRIENQVAVVDVCETARGVLAKAVVEDHDPPVVYETVHHRDERSALADVATWLRSRCDASMTCLATDQGAVVLVTGGPDLRTREGVERSLDANPPGRAT